MKVRKQPSIYDFAQLFAMGDHQNFKSIIEFLVVEDFSPCYPFHHFFYETAKNRSGFCSISAGNQNNDTGKYRLLRNFMGLKTASDDSYVNRIKLAIDTKYTILVDITTNIDPGTSMKFDLMSVRYCMPF